MTSSIPHAAPRTGRAGCDDVTFGNGSTFWNALFVSPVFDRAGDLIYFLGSQLDVSRRRDAEESLHQAQKMESLGQLTEGIAHDFDNLLQVISGHNEVTLALLDDSHVDLARLRRAAEAVREASDRAAKLTHQLLAFSRKQRLEGRTTPVEADQCECLQFRTRSAGSGRLGL